MAQNKTKQIKKTVSIVGIGRIGLPLALVLAETGFLVYGIDKDVEHIKLLKRGIMPFIEEGAEGLLKKYLNVGFFPTLEIEYPISHSDYIILTLGTPVDENLNPVLSQIQEAVKEIIPYLKKNQLIILRSTVSPNTTQFIRDFIEKKTNLKTGKDIFIAFCPERVAEGHSLEEIRSIPQIIGGIDSVSAQKADEFFANFVKKRFLTDAVSAELAKLFTNMYRYISFAIPNEFMIIAKKYNRDIFEIIDLVNRDYKRGGLARPGLTSGPCLFKDGFFLINDIPFMELIATSWKIHESMPLFLIQQIKEKTSLKNKKVVILGLAFKAESDDIRESLSFKAKKGFEREQARVFLHDPYVLEYNQRIEDVLQDAEIIFVGTNHKDYYHMDLKKITKLVKPGCLFCDIWNIFKTDKIIFNVEDIKKSQK